MTDLAKTIAPKSDQLNADDLIAGPRTITITAVRGCDEPDQPVAVHFEGDDRKPYKPCKSMRRVMVHCWGPDGKTYAGRRMTLYRDENVQFGGIKVGGIRISHLSHIEREMTMALTATRAKRTPYTVKPLRAEVRQAAREDQARTKAPVDQDEDAFPGDRRDSDAVAVEDWAAALSRTLDSFDDVDLLREAWTARKDELKAANPDLWRELNRSVAGRAQEIAEGGE